MNILTHLKTSRGLKRCFSSLPSTNDKLYDFSFTPNLDLISEGPKLNCFRVIDENGKLVNDKKYVDIPKEKLLKIYETMVTNNEADLIFNMAQRQN